MHGIILMFKLVNMQNYPFNFTIIIFFFLLFHPYMAASMDIHTALSAGYDNNPSVTGQTTVGRRPVINYEELPGSAFVTIEAGMGHEFLFPGLGIGVSGEINGYSSSYFGLGNKRQVDASTLMSKIFLDGIIIPYITAGGSVYRDDPTDLNSLDEFYSGAGVTINPVPECSVDITSLYHWLYYTEKLEAGVGPVSRGQGNMHGINNMNGNMPVMHSVNHNEKLLESGFDITFFLMPELYLTGGFMYSDLDSSLEVNSYSQIRLSAGFSLFLPGSFNLETGFSWFESSYDDHGAELATIKNRTWSAWGKLSREWEQLIFSLAVDWQQNAEVSDLSSGSRMITEAGLEWRF